MNKQLRILFDRFVDYEDLYKRVVVEFGSEWETFYLVPVTFRIGTVGRPYRVFVSRHERDIIHATVGDRSFKLCDLIDDLNTVFMMDDL